MKNSLLFIMILCIGVTTNSQNIGFMGRKNCLGGAFCVENVGNNSINSMPNMTLERTLNMQNSFDLMFFYSSRVGSYENAGYKLNSKLKFNISDDYNNLEPPFTTDAIIHGNFKTSISTIQAGYRHYRLKKGALAPYGKFIAFGLKLNRVAISSTNAYLVGATTGVKKDPVIIHLSYDEYFPILYNLGGYCALGEKRFLNNKHFFEYAFELNLDGYNPRMFNIYYFIDSHMYAAQVITLNEILLPTFIKIRFAYGLAL
ncbi:MAG: hypothetical protein R3A43_03080 [Bacteroidia bacterium]